MGVTIDELEQVCKTESQKLLDCLSPDEQHKLRMIKQNVSTDGDKAIQISLRQALARAYRTIGIAIKATEKDPIAHLSLKENLAPAVKQIRDTVLSNPAFDDFG